MIIDCHAHIGRKEHTPAAFLEEMLQPMFRAAGKAIPPAVYEGIDTETMMDAYRQAGVDKVFIYGMAPREQRAYGRDPATRVKGAPYAPNEYVAEIHRQYPDLTVPVMTANPLYEGDAVVDNVEYAVRELGAKAIKIYPTYNHYRPDDREVCWPLYEKVQLLGVPLIVHQAWTTTVDAPMKFQQPWQLDDVARDFRELTIILAHFGVPWVDEAMCLVAKHDNVYTDLSFWTLVELPEMILLQLLRCPRYGCNYDRILWGSDYPLTTPAESLAILREELPRAAERMQLPMIPDDALELILGGNAARIYRLD
jgi:predicted TIM-barrel fold metal-dependent hydrolase